MWETPCEISTHGASWSRLHETWPRASGVEVRAALDENLDGTIEIDREAWAVAPESVHWSCTSSDPDLSDDD